MGWTKSRRSLCPKGRGYAFLSTFSSQVSHSQSIYLSSLREEIRERHGDLQGENLNIPATMRSIRLTKCCFSLILITLPQTLATLTGPCYNLVGDELGDTFAPCNPDASVASACCQTNVTSYGDICLDSGLCMATANEAVGFVFQAGCTDSSGAADGCPTLCSSSMYCP